MSRGIGLRSSRRVLDETDGPSRAHRKVAVAARWWSLPRMHGIDLVGKCALAKERKEQLLSRLAGALLLAAASALIMSPQASAVVDPVASLDCAVGTVADPAGAVVAPSEVPLVGCLTP